MRATAVRALTAGELIRSGRRVRYLWEFRKHLAWAVDATVVTDSMRTPVGTGCG